MQVPGVETSGKVIATVRSHASVAVGGVNTGVAGHAIGDVCVTQVIVGGVISCTTMVPLQVAVLPHHRLRSTSWSYYKFPYRFLVW